jgi:hypothetical protein
MRDHPFVRCDLAARVPYRRIVVGDQYMQWSGFGLKGSKHRACRMVKSS